MAQRSQKKRPIQVVELARADIGPLLDPVRAPIRLKLDHKSSAFVFTMTTSARAGMTDEYFVKMAQSLGDRVHPHQCALVILPDEAPDLRAYRVTVEGTVRHLN